jgi:putative sterol carrier protein
MEGAGMARRPEQSTAHRDPTGAFFNEFATRTHKQLLHRTSGALRVEVTEGTETERFLIAVDQGDVSVSKRTTRADATLKAERSLFNGMVEGEVNAVAAVLRGVVVVEGDLGLAASFIRLFPGPPDSLRSFYERQRARENG